MNIALLILLIGQWLIALVALGTKSVTGSTATTAWVLALVMTFVVAVGGWLAI